MEDSLFMPELAGYLLLLRRLSGQAQGGVRGLGAGGMY
jgi:hypothetical protein